MPKLVINYDQSWKEPTPCLYGREDDNVIILENPVVCSNCGAIAKQRMSYVWKGTKNKRLLSLGFGASVKHYFTECRECDFCTVS